MKTLAIWILLVAAWLWMQEPQTMQEKADAECVAVAGAGYHAVNVGMYLEGRIMTHGTWCARD